MSRLIQALTVVLIVYAQPATAICTAYCTPGKSYACGQGCISIYKNCHKPTTTACNGSRPKFAEKHYTPSEIKKVEPVPVEGVSK